MEQRLDLLSLPVSVIYNVLCSTLSLTDLVRLDSAYCCQNREFLVDLVQSKPFTFHAPVNLSDTEQLKWLSNKKVKVSDVEFSLELVKLDEIRLSKYLRLYGSSIRTVHFINGDNTQEMNLTAINCRNLTKVCVAGATLSMAFTNVLHCNPTIQRLECRDVTSEQADLLEGLSMHRLQILHLDEFNCDGFDGCIWHATTQSSSLHTAIVESCTFDDVDLRMLFSNCPQLKSFSWTWAAVGSCLLADCASLMTGLVNLSVGANGSMTDAGMLTIAQKLTYLRTLDIQRCDALTDVTILHLANHLGDALEVLYVDIKNPESKETEEVLQVFSQKCTKLRYLNVDCGDKTLCTGRGTGLLMRGCPALRTLVLNRHDVICGSSREFITAMRPELKLLVHDDSTVYDILSMPI